MQNDTAHPRAFRRYGLLDHLRALCARMPEYEPLLHTLMVDIGDFKNKLETVNLYYGNYSKHDITHAEAVIANMEQLLGEDRILLLGPTDTWLLLMAAYSHDTGMWLGEDRIKSIWKDAAFHHHVTRIRRYGSSRQDLREAAFRFSNSNDTIKTHDELQSPAQYRELYAMEAAIKDAWYAKLLISDYLRGKHAANARLDIENDISQYTHGDVIPLRLVSLFAKCAAAHGMQQDDILGQLDRITNGFLGDHAHPRFVATMLRLGDALDIDNNRFNPYMADVFGGMPDDSQYHRLKHKAMTHILVTPSIVELRADLSVCDQEKKEDEEAERLVTETLIVVDEWFKMVERELRFFNKHWFELVPDPFPGKAPWFDKGEIYYRGRLISRDDLLFEFSISYDRAFEIIQARSFYNDGLVFLRELLQNAFDAMKLQFYANLNAPPPAPCRYQKAAAADGDPDTPSEGDGLWLFARMLAFLIRKPDYGQVELSMCSLVEQGTKDQVEFVVKDRATGIDNPSIQRMRSVGEAQDDKKRKRIQDLPGWLKPTGAFGFGLHSVFIAADRFDIHTLALHPTPLRACIKLHAHTQGGRIIIGPYEKKNECVEQGAHVIVRTSYDRISNMTSPLLGQFGMDFRQLMALVDEYIGKSIAPNIFPLKISYYEGGAHAPVHQKIESIFADLCEEVKSRILQGTPEGTPAGPGAVSDADIAAKLEHGNAAFDAKEVRQLNRLTLKHLKDMDRDNCLLFHNSLGDGRNMHYYALCINRERIFNDAEKNLLVSVRFLDAFRPNAPEMAIAFKGAYISHGVKQLSFPYIDMKIDILGRHAKQTVTVQRDYLLKGAAMEILAETKQMLYAILVQIVREVRKTGVPAAQSVGEGAFSLALYLHCLLWQSDRALTPEEKNMVQDTLASIRKYYEQGQQTQMGGFHASKDVLQPFDIVVSDYLNDPLQYYYIREENQPYSKANGQLIGDAKDLTCTLNVQLAKLPVQLSIAEIRIFEGPGEQYFLVRYESGTRATADVSDESLDALLKSIYAQPQNKAKPWRYMPAVSNFPSLSIRIADSKAQEEWEACSSFLQLPEISPTEGNRHMQPFLSACAEAARTAGYATLSIPENPNLKTLFHNAFAGYIENVFQHQFTPQQFTREDIKNDLQKLVVRILPILP